MKYLVIVMTPQALVSEMTRREWHAARQRGLLVYPVKGVPDDQLDYAAVPGWMRKAHWFDLGRWTGQIWEDVKAWDTFVHYLKSDRQPTRVPFMAPALPPTWVPRPGEFDQVLQPLLQRSMGQPVAITTAVRGAGGYGKTTHWPPPFATTIACARPSMMGCSGPRSAKPRQSWTSSQSYIAP